MLALSARAWYSGLAGGWKNSGMPSSSRSASSRATFAGSCTLRAGACNKQSRKLGLCLHRDSKETKHADTGNASRGQQGRY